MRPIIGITQDLEFKERGGFWAYLDKSYADAVYQFGGMPFMIPIMEGESVPEEYARRIDGLFLSGGDDIHPRYYSEELMDGTMLSPTCGRTSISRCFGRCWRLENRCWVYASASSR